MMPRARSERTRASAVEGATPTAVARRALEIRASAARSSSRRRSIASRSSFGIVAILAAVAEGSATRGVAGEGCSGSGSNSRTDGTLRSMSATTAGPTVDIKDSILDAIGETPLVRLSRLAAGLTPQVVAKVEALNPGGSIKDRVAVALIDAAEREGKLKPGGTIVEPTSGNTGTGLAIAARLKGYRVIAVMPDKMSREKIDLLRAYGAEVVIAPTDVAPESPQADYRVADRLTEEIPAAFQPNQYKNPPSPQPHYETSAPELWRQTAGRVTHLVVGVGTGGTVTGMGRYLKEQSPDIEVIGADPVGSISSGGADNVR